MENTTQIKKGYFINETAAEEFSKSYLKILTELKRKITSQYMPPESTQRFKHGEGWTHPSAPEVFSGKMHTHSARIEISFQEIVDNDLESLERSFKTTIEILNEQFAKMFYSTLSDVCEQTGNTVDAKKEASLIDAFIAMLEKIEFVPDKKGGVTFPQIHAAPDTVDKLIKAFENATPEEKELIDKIQSRKISDALQHEEERKAKFVNYGGEK